MYHYVHHRLYVCLLSAITKCYNFSSEKTYLRISSQVLLCSHNNFVRPLSVLIGHKNHHYVSVHKAIRNTGDIPVVTRKCLFFSVVLKTLL